MNGGGIGQSSEDRRVENQHSQAVAGGGDGNDAGMDRTALADGLPTHLGELPKAKSPIARTDPHHSRTDPHLTPTQR